MIYESIIEVLKTKDFKKLWFIGITGMSMRWIEQIALGFYVYQITKDEFLVGLVFFLEIFLCFCLVHLWGNFR